MTNTGNSTAKWKVELDLPVGEADDIVFAVDAGRTIRLQIPIDITRAEDAVSATVSLLDARGVVSKSTLQITSVNLSDCG